MRGAYASGRVDKIDRSFFFGSWCSWNSGHDFMILHELANVATGQQAVSTPWYCGSLQMQNPLATVAHI